MLISAKLNKLKYHTNALLLKNTKNHLDVDSIVKLDAVYKLLQGDILFKLGRIDIDKVKEYKKRFEEIINE